MARKGQKEADSALLVEVKLTIRLLCNAHMGMLLTSSEEYVNSWKIREKEEDN